MPGYANRVVRIPFPDLTEKGEPELFITIKNPKTLPPDELMAGDIAVHPDGTPVDMAAATQRSRELIAGLVLAWRMYDGKDFQLDAEGNPADQVPLPLPATPELVAKLPTRAIMALNDAISEAVSPKSE